VKVVTRGALGLLVVAGLLVGIGRWTERDSQLGIDRNRITKPERTFDDRQKHTIKLVVRYRPARGVYVTWMIHKDGDVQQRGWGDVTSWEETRTNVPEGAVASLMLDNESEGGYVNCEVRMDGVLVRHHVDEHSPANRNVCDLYYVVGDRAE
jgi:hypothetical protein